MRRLLVLFVPTEVSGCKGQMMMMAGREALKFVSRSKTTDIYVFFYLRGTI